MKIVIVPTEHHLFDIEYDGQPLHVMALCRESAYKLVYDCYTNDVLLGTLRPTIGDDPALYWIGEDMPTRFVKLVGDEIERRTTTLNKSGF
jgi:hypothetical protein